MGIWILWLCRRCVESTTTRLVHFLRGVIPPLIFPHLSMSFLSSTFSFAFFIPSPLPKLSKAAAYIFM